MNDFSFYLGYLVKDFLPNPLSTFEDRRDVVKNQNKEEKKKTINHHVNVENDYFMPVATFEYHPNSYENWLKQKFHMIHRNAEFREKEQKPQNYFEYQKNDLISFKSPLTRKPTTLSEDYDFKPYFPNYNTFTFGDAKSDHPEDEFKLNKEPQKVKPTSRIDTLESWDKFLDTKTVIAGVDVVKIKPESY